MLVQFRRQHFLLFMIAHFQKAALLMMSDRPVEALERLDVGDAPSLRRQANTVVRLTVVTFLGLIGTVTTGFLGMNLLAEADAPVTRKLLVFGAVFVATIALTACTMVKSRACRSYSMLGPTSGRRRGSKPRWRCRVDCPLCRKSSRKAGAPR